MRKTAANKGFSAMLASEYILIDISLISCSPNCGSPISFGINHQLSIFTQRQYRATVTRNISTAESPGRCMQFYAVMLKCTIPYLVAFLTAACFSSCGQSEFGSRNLKSRFDTRKAVILELKEIPSWIFDSTYRPINLTQSEAAVIDSFMSIAVADFNNDQKKINPGNSWMIDLNAHHYKSQVVAAINKDGQKEIWVNCFCGENHPNWKTGIVFVEDGATCYFNFKVNLVKRVYYDFFVNSAG